MEKIIIKKFNAAIGYGEIYAVPSEAENVCKFFDLISIWQKDRWTNKRTNKTVILYELPINGSLELENPCFQLALERLNASIEVVAVHDFEGYH